MSLIFSLSLLKLLLCGVNVIDVFVPVLLEPVIRNFQGVQPAQFAIANSSCVIAIYVENGCV